VTDELRKRQHEVRPIITPTQGTGVVLYAAGAVIAFCGFPRLDDGLLFPLRGWAGVLGTVLLGVSPRAGVIRSLGLIGLWISGLFIGKNPFVFLLGTSILLTGIALFNHTPLAVLPADEEPKEWDPLDANAESPEIDHPSDE
jgi:hypothetical protein